ncbi:MAG: NlpC/P60 family protein [Actinomycetota bacterium]|nr:NlpC/P60 family protein [Actinomycetota bacterium]
MARGGNRCVAVSVALAAVVMAGSVVPVGADPQRVQDTEGRVDETRRAASRAAHRLDELARAAELAVESYNEANERLTAVRRQMAEVVAEIQHLETAMQERQDLADGFARRLYRQGLTHQIAVVLDAGDAAEAQTRLTLLRSAAQAQLSVVDALRGDRRVRAAHLARLETVRAEAAAAERSLAGERNRVEGLLATQRGEVEQLRQAVADAEDAHAEAVRVEEERLARQRSEREARERAERERVERERIAHQAHQRAQAAAREAARRATETTRATTPPAPPTRSEPRDPPPPAGDRAQTAVDAALSQVGKPYRWGAEGPDAYDCSGLTKWAWAKAGVALPHSSRMQYQVTARVPRSDLRPGDLMFFGSPIHHVALYIGNGKVVEAPYSGERVRINDRTVHRSDLVGIGRPTTR